MVTSSGDCGECPPFEPALLSLFRVKASSIYAKEFLSNFESIIHVQNLSN